MLLKAIGESKPDILLEEKEKKRNVGSLTCPYLPLFLPAIIVQYPVMMNKKNGEQ